VDLAILLPLMAHHTLFDSQMSWAFLGQQAVASLTVAVAVAREQRKEMIMVAKQKGRQHQHQRRQQRTEKLAVGAVLQATVRSAELSTTQSIRLGRVRLASWASMLATRSLWSTTVMT